MLTFLQMNRILWVDHENMMARLEAGIVGSHLEQKVLACATLPDECKLSNEHNHSPFECAVCFARQRSGSPA